MPRVLLSQIRNTQVAAMPVPQAQLFDPLIVVDLQSFRHDLNGNLPLLKRVIHMYLTGVII